MSVKDVQEMLGVPLLGAIPEVRRCKARPQLESTQFSNFDCEKG